jgi:hypothetical protein
MELKIVQCKNAELLRFVKKTIFFRVYAYDVQRNFETELKNLLVAITKERKSLQE